MATTLRKHKTRRKKPKKVKPLPTIWEVSDDLWQRLLPILAEFWPTQPTGRHHANWRKAINGIIFRMRSGCQWDQLPRKFGPKSTVHDWFQRWCQGGVHATRLGRVWSRNVTNSGGWTGECRAPMADWARPGSGEKKVAKTPRIVGKTAARKRAG